MLLDLGRWMPYVGAALLVAGIFVWLLDLPAWSALAASLLTAVAYAGWQHLDRKRRREAAGREARKRAPA